MLVKAIEKVSEFTKPIHTITRTYGGLVSPGTSTLFFVNENGVAITCKHVLNLILNADMINRQYVQFREEKNKLANDGKFKRNIAGLELKHKYKKESLIQIKNNFINGVSPITEIKTFAHPTLDLAILIFEGFNQKHYGAHATFVKDPNKLKQGRYLGRLGYPFPEFNNFKYNPSSDDIEWTQEGNQHTPSFPIDGIITRFISNGQELVGIEMSTPGLRGQSGGPLFDTDGLIYGMQSETGHLHLGFDISDMEIIQDGKRTKVSNYPFLHVGRCIHAEQIKAFLKLNGIKYYEE
jgi:hypothetical protein